jgi:adenine/guanine phosphoribosyltransferase-like PRPP-binding protein
LSVQKLANGRHGLASLIINQASFAVQDALATDLAQRIECLEPDVVVGLPTLGLTLASAVPRKLGHARYVPLGTSRKVWYRDDLPPLSSVTTPHQETPIEPLARIRGDSSGKGRRNFSEPRTAF